MIWVRLASTPTFCAIVRVADSVAFAHCCNAMPSYDVVELDKKPEHESRCTACVDALVEQRTREWAGG